ncbi:prepilin peptidase [Yoonia sediminilitoris]|uniref:Prepilin peptidase CpaA n=1 Tax=Yoonia sediminilitoris TaxID=1286148 RepID=A0A2T6KK58_9RHOB|nr:prepilin peptidase [Yoonia sediminilitoris]PUB16325.1 prepilin peptidase CpaA [Yoonia sediminilitoris]RCW96674.1 prepilin peptidase CpaA [Yoonia sediminilitoris]
MAMTAEAAYWFLPAVIPFSIYVAWRDLSTMKIPNKANMILLGIYAVFGLFAFPFDLYLWQWLHIPIVFAVGLLLWMGRLMGAGDVKFLVAASPFFVVTSWDDGYFLIVLYTSSLLAGVIVFYSFKFLPVLHAPVSGWQSLREGRRFPKGPMLAVILLAYLILAAVYG